MQRTEAAVLAETEHADSSALKQGKLEAIDKLLWGTQVQRVPQTHGPEGEGPF